MNDQIAQHETKLPDREQEILDTALLESDQLLARSLHDDDQRRRCKRLWLWTVFLGGVVMSWIGYAVIAGWFTVSGQVATSTEGNAAASATSEQMKEEDLAWRERFLTTSEKDPWHVGANIGKELVQIPGKRPHTLLKTNWKKIPVSVRKQILKGFTPGMMGNQETHEQFFNVMHLGMSDKNAEVRNFAASYLEMQGLPNYERDLKAYKKWREKTEKLTSIEVMKLIDSQPKQQLTSEQHTAKGWELWKQQRYTDAVDHFSSAVEQDAKAVNAWNGLGWALFNSGQSEKALPAFRKAIKLSPRHPAALNGLGQVLFFQGDLKQAERYLKKAAPRAPAAWWGLTKVYLLTGKYKQAEKWAEKVAAGSPDDPLAKQMLQDAQAGKLSEDLRQMIEPISMSEDDPESEEPPAE